MPWLEPAAAMVSDGDWGVAVVSRRAARLFRGGPGGLTEFMTIDDELHRRHDQGGWSQARFQRGIEEQVAAHARGVGERLLRAHRRRPLEHLVIVCSDELRPVVEHSLHHELVEVLVGTVDADLEHATAADITQRVAPLMECAQRDRERALIARLEQALGTGGPAAAGLDDVLSALEEDRVETLVVPEGGRLTAAQCPTCGRLWTDASRRCPLDGASLAARIIVAVLVCTREWAATVGSEVDEIFCYARARNELDLNRLCERFLPVPDAEVLALLDVAACAQAPTPGQMPAPERIAAVERPTPVSCA